MLRTETTVIMSLYKLGFMVVSLTEEKPLLEFFTRFWRRQLGHAVCYPAKFKLILESMNITFKQHLETDLVDISDILKDGVSSQNQRHYINCFTQVDTFKYPNELVQKVIDYFSTISISEGSKKILKANRQIFILF